MRSNHNRASDRAAIMLEIVSKVVASATGITPEQLRSQACDHKTTQARFIFSELCCGVVSPVSLLPEYLNKNPAMVSYYKRLHNDYYTTYKDFREMSDKADALLTELLTNVNGTIGNVFQREEDEQVQC